MVSFYQVLVASAFAALSSAAPAEEKRSPVKPFTVNLVPKVGSTPLNGYQAYTKAFQKFGAGGAENAVIQAAAASSVTATPAEYDSEYTCPVKIGTQTFQLDFDTGSADLWVLGSSVSASGKTKYTPGSTAARVTGDTWSIQYGDGSSASGIVYTDTVTVGGTSVTGQYVEVASKASGSFTDASEPLDGLLGLSFDSINTATPKKATTFFTTAINQGLPSKVFTALLKKGTPGSYTFGTIPTSQYTGAITYTNVDSSQGFWEFTSSGYAVGTGATVSTSISGIADTGTTLLLLPASVVSAYYAKVSGARSSGGAYIFSCTATLPNFTVTINGYKAVVPGSYINYAPNGDGTCYGGIQSSAGLGINIFGDIFLKSQFVVFDKTQSTPRIGFAKQA